MKTFGGASFSRRTLFLTGLMPARAYTRVKRDRQWPVFSFGRRLRAAAICFPGEGKDDAEVNASRPRYCARARRMMAQKTDCFTARRF